MRSLPFLLLCACAGGPLPASTDDLDGGTLLDGANADARGLPAVDAGVLPDSAANLDGGGLVGQQRFSPAGLPTVLYPGTLAAGDVDGDGRLDLVAIDGECVEHGASGAVHTLIGTGGGAFRLVESATFGAFHSAALGDLDGDGHLDLVVGDGPLVALLGVGDGSFTGGTTSRSLVSTPVTGDFDGDGRTDVAVVMPGEGSVLSLYLGKDGVLGFRPTFIDTTIGLDVPLLAADFDGDGHLDLAMASQRGFSIYTGSGDGKFQRSDVAGAGNALAAADLDGDGRLDLVTTWSTATAGGLRLGLSAGAATGYTFVDFAGPLPEAVAAADLDGDGAIDLAILSVDAGHRGSLSVRRGDGTGRLDPPVTLAQLAGYHAFTHGAVVAADLDGDGRTDLAATMSGCGEIALLLAR